MIFIKVISREGTKFQNLIVHVYFVLYLPALQKTSFTLESLVPVLLTFDTPSDSSSSTFSGKNKNI